MFNFPDSPTNGQMYAPAGGPSYQWNAATGAWLTFGGASEASVFQFGPAGAGQWFYNTATATPPATGTLRFDNADPFSASVIYFAPVTSQGRNVANWLNEISQPGAVVFMQEVANPANYAIFDVVDHANMTTYVGVWVTPRIGNPLTANALLAVAVIAGGGGSASISVGETAPGSPASNQLWWESDSGNLYIWYDDGSSQQWVQVATGGNVGIVDRLQSTAADMSAGFRAGTPNRFVINDAADLSGNDVVTLDELGHMAFNYGGASLQVPAASRSALTVNGDFSFNSGFTLYWNGYWDTAASANKFINAGWLAGMFAGASNGVIQITRSTASGAAGATATPTNVLQFDPTAGATFGDYLLTYGNGSAGIVHQGRSTLVDWYKIAGSNSFRWLKSSNGLTSGTGVTVLASLDDAGSLTIPGVFTATSSIQTNNGNLIARASSGNAQVTYQNSAGTTVGYCYADFGSSYMTLQNNFGSGSSIQLTSAGGVLLSGASNGYRGKAGSNGAISASCHNWYYSAPNIQAWVDLTNLGNVTLSSDYRIKKDVQPLGSMWEAVKGLKPISYTQAAFTPPAQLEAVKAREAAGEKGLPPTPMFPADDILRYGFIAHELQQDLIPTAAEGEKDAPDQIQSLNLAPVVAALTKALQEAMARIEALEARP